MLAFLEITNYALIDHLTVEFCPKLNIITGETGSGKSILIDALNMVLGGRTSVDSIRTGEELFTVEARFLVAAAHPASKFVEEGADVLVLRRELAASGRSRCFANGRRIGVRALRDLGRLLVDLHGQHDHQSLLDTHKHLDFLDAFGKLEYEQERVAAVYRELSELESRQERSRLDVADFTARRELLSHQADEIRSADVQPEEDEELLEALGRLSHAERLLEIAQEIENILYEQDRSVAELLGMAEGLAQEGASSDVSFGARVKEVAELRYAAEEITRQMSTYAGGIDSDPAELARVNSRLDELSVLKKKYGGDIHSIISVGKKAEEELVRLRGSEDLLSGLEEEIAQARDAFSTACRDLAAKRKEAAFALSEAIKASLVDLGMADVNFDVDLAWHKDPEGCAEIDGENYAADERGLETGEFLISTNPGEESRPLVRVASGGEISRIMLAMKTILTGTDSVQVLIFDEIDTGISGRVADAVGRRLEELSSLYQTVSITHLPQIAARADLHLSVRKQVVSDRTTTRVDILSDEEKVQEIASMMGGTDVSELTIRHARELIGEAGRR